MADEPVKPAGDEVTPQDLTQHHIVPADRNRWVLLHYHIFKNAGSTIESVLQRSFGERFATLHGPEEGSALNGPDVAAFLAGHPNLAAISSHHVRYPKPVAPQVIVFDICFFRDPLQRLWSMYKFIRRSEQAEGKNSKAMNARSFFEELLQEHPHLVNDVQVCTLATRGEYTRPPTGADLRLAQEILSGISVLGVVELFDESALAAEYFLRPTFPMLQFHYVRQNADPASYASPEKEKEEFRNQVGDSIYGQLVHMNELDTELVACARTEVMRRWALLPNKDARVADFRKRCRILSEQQDALAADKHG
jgi:hypothetical protein